MDEFVSKLNKLFETAEVHKTWIDPSPELDEVISLACKYLINDFGYVNWDNVRTLCDKGYKVYAGEKDSFGWVTGVIDNCHGKRLMFG